MYMGISLLIKFVSGYFSNVSLLNTFLPVISRLKIFGRKIYRIMYVFLRDEEMCNVECHQFYAIRTGFFAISVGKTF